MPRDSSSGTSAAAAAGPNSSSGSSSGVTSVTVASATPCSRRWLAVIIASSYSGSGHIRSAGSANATDRARPVTRSCRTPRSAGTSPRPWKVRAPGRPRPRDRAGGDDQGVEADALPAGGDGGRLARVDRAEHVMDELSATLVGEDLGQVVGACLGPVERLGDGHGPVDEFVRR